MLLEQIDQDAASLVPRAFQSVDPRQIQIRLIERRRHADALLKACHGLIAALRDQVEYSEIIQSLWVNGPSLQRALQILISFGGVIGLRIPFPGCSSLRDLAERLP